MLREDSYRRDKYGDDDWSLFRENDDSEYAFVCILLIALCFLVM